LLTLISDIRKRFKTELARIEPTAQEHEGEAGERPSERAMRESEVLRPKPKKPSARQEDEGRENLEKEATRISETERRSREESLERLEKEGQERPFKVVRRAVEEGPFYQPY